RVELGFNPKNILTTHFTIPRYKYKGDETRKGAFIDRVIDRIKPLPGIISVAATSSVPLRGADFHQAGPIAGKTEHYSARFRAVSHDYFRTMGVRLLKGRAFTEQDTEQSRKVAVVTQEFVRRYFPNEEPLGQRLDPLETNAEIVGVVADV